MPAMGIIDDRNDLRETLLRRVDSELQGAWQTVDTAPLHHMQDYPAWIAEYDVAVILLDERLNEQVEVAGKQIGYDGHDLVEFIRQYLPTFPIFIITSYKSDEELSKKFSDVEDIIDRKEFLKKAEEYVPRFLRSGQKFLQMFQAELNELAKKADKIAKGKATTEDIETANAIRARIGLAFPSEPLGDRSQWLNKIEEKLEELRQLTREIEKFLES
jgi:hypothetical protein